MDKFIKHLKNIRSNQVRIITGVIMYIYAVTHLLNHSVGLLGLDAMEEVRLYFLAFWRNPVMIMLMPMSMMIHFFLAVYAFLTKPSLMKMSIYEWVQYVAGFTIPFFLILHVSSTRMAYWFFDINDTYAYLLTQYWNQGLPALLLTFLLVSVFVHGSIGIYFYLRLQKWFHPVKPYYYAISLALPLMAIAGILSASRESLYLSGFNPQWTEQILQTANPGLSDVSVMMKPLFNLFPIGYFIFLDLMFIFRILLIWYKEKRYSVNIHFLNQKKVRVFHGSSILDASNSADLPHAQICRGKGRCTTCRVYVVDGHENLSKPEPNELDILEGINASPNIRLACQARPLGEVTVDPLFPADLSAQEGVKKKTMFFGNEKKIAVLFADLRGFTTFSEHRLPYDVVSILNGYFKGAGIAIEKHGGHLDKFIGDGIMAIFGLENGYKAGSRQAIQASVELNKQVEVLNKRFKRDMGNVPLKLGIGIHTGIAIVGEMGFKHTMHLTAIGDTVNTASRLEGTTKQFQCKMVVSKDVVTASSLDFSGFPLEKLVVRGRSGPIDVYTIYDPLSLENLY